MRKSVWLLLVALAAILALSACGSKSQEDVANGLSKKVKELKGYKASAKMTLQMGSDPQSYDIDIWHNKPGMYRVHLKNAVKEQSQMILRNSEGVFVLTPALNKSYRFQSDWPQNSSQAYLYESLVKDVLEDKQASFKTTKDHFVFETKTRYQNSKLLPIQEITFNKNLEPVRVKVMDTDRKAVVTVDFKKVTFNAKFDKDAFDTKRNMTGARLEVPASSQSQESEFTVKYVMADIPGIELQEEKAVKTGSGKRVVLVYGGKDKKFTLIQEKAEVVQAASAVSDIAGEMVDLGFAIGAMTANSIVWNDGGIEYMLASNDLTPEEMVMAAKSVQGAASK